MADSEQKTGNFTVTDRRAFDASGERKSDQPTAADKPAQVIPPPVAQPQVAQPQAAPSAPEPPLSLPPADFPTLVLSLGSSAAMYLGQSVEPDGKRPTRNLPMAKHAIDLLTVLEEKTKGNLSSEEEQILESLLFDLRLGYVEALKTASGGG
jgi:hypothetical protein